MATYLVQFTYTPETWATLLQKPQDRSTPSQELVQRLGGKLLGLYYTLGAYDGIALLEAPDDLTASAVSLAVKASGIMKMNEVTRLFSMDETLEAMRKANSGAFSPPRV
ncbi:GYD domain-containing protein [Dictyobacter sp. S3.2.2.5]|uniref:GYD domain-containing protein n=1 Tax=Dictyobacter halimunensis TaxID=3026934 RepID=A0ABQ6FZP7_9CHLR|nr:GYD domain-containing protein [Dictyobacter sp. S3.2.2.5]